MLTPDEKREAASLGWELVDVYDLAKKKWVLTVMPVNFPTRPVRDVQIEFIEQTRSRIKVAMKALKLVVSSNASRRST